LPDGDGNGGAAVSTSLPCRRNSARRRGGSDRINPAALHVAERFQRWHAGPLKLDHVGENLQQSRAGGNGFAGDGTDGVPSPSKCFLCGFHNSGDARGAELLSRRGDFGHAGHQLFSTFDSIFLRGL
jgi:hypothetical protein